MPSEQTNRLIERLAEIFGSEVDCDESPADEVHARGDCLRCNLRYAVEKIISSPERCAEIVATPPPEEKAENVTETLFWIGYLRKGSRETVANRIAQAIRQAEKAARLDEHDELCQICLNMRQMDATERCNRRKQLEESR